MKNRANNQKWRLGFLFILCSFAGFSQSNNFTSRTSLELKKKWNKKISLEVKPEFRFNSEFYLYAWLVQGGFNYRIIPWLTIGGLYRVEAGQTASNENEALVNREFSNRFALDAQAKFNVARITPKFRVRYCNFSDFNQETDNKSNYLRYRVALNYNIKGVKLSPFVSAEYYHKLRSGLISKARYSVGTEYTINKRNAVSINYSVSQKFKTQTTEQLVELGYQIKF